MPDKRKRNNSNKGNRITPDTRSIIKDIQMAEAFINKTFSSWAGSPWR